MRKWYSTIDSKTDMEIVFSECSLNEVGFQLEVVDRLEVYDCVKNNNGMYEITTKTRTFYYDEDRRMLLGE